MRKIIFLVFLFFSSFVFGSSSVPCHSLFYINQESSYKPIDFESDWVDMMIDFPPVIFSDLLFYKNCSLLTVGVSDITYTESSSELNYRYYTMFATYSVPSPMTDLSCPNKSPFLFNKIPFYVDNHSLEFHHGCIDDAGGNEEFLIGCENYYSADVPQNKPYAEHRQNYYSADVPHKAYFALYCPPASSASEQTAIKENDLISESNSKLGSVASSNSANTDLLNKIKNSLTALLSKNSAVFGVDSNASNEPIPLTSEISLSSISPLMSKSGSCPADISISVMNSTHHLSYQPLCDFANKLHPLVIAAARVSAAWLVIGAL